jgi:hypothetical protein
MNSNVASLMSKLTRVFNGGKSNVTFSTFNHDGTPYTQLEQREVRRGPVKTTEDWYRINMPSYMAWAEARTGEARQQGQTPDEELIYRLYKGSAWHENQHVRFSPPKFLKGDEGFNSRTKRTLFNIIDDRRIEELGVNKLPGLVPVRLLRQAYWGSLRPDVSQLSKNYTDENELKKMPGIEGSTEQFAQKKFGTKNPTPEQINESFEEHKESFRQTMRKEAVMEAFTQRLLMGGKQKGDLPKEDQEKLDQVTIEIQNELTKMENDEDQSETRTYSGLKNLVEKFMQAMNIPDDDKDETRPDLPDPHMGDGHGPGAGEGLDQKEIESYLQSLTPDKEGKREDGDPGTELTREDIEKALNGTPQEKIELLKIISKSRGKGSGHGGTEEDPEAPSEFSEPLERGEPSLYRDKKFIMKMNELLHEWRAGWRRVFGTSGTTFNLQHELATKGEESFSGRKRLDASKTKTLFIVDFSGSMSEREEDYKRVLSSTMEVLEGIHSQTAIFGFGDPTVDFFKVKDFRQRWNRERQEQLAGIEAAGSTPLTSTINMLAPYIKRHRPQYTVIITDGSPTDGDPTSLIKSLQKETHFVGFGLGGPGIAMALKRYGVKESFSVQDPYEVPKKLVPKIAPVS